MNRIILIAGIILGVSVGTHGILFAENDQDELVKKIGSSSARNLIKLANDLSATGETLPKVQLALAKRLDEQDVEVRVAVVDAIPYLGQPDAEVIKLIFESMKLGGLHESEGKYYVEFAVDSLEHFGKRTLELAIQSLESKNVHLYAGATDVIFRLGADAESAVEALSKRLGPGKLQWSTAYALSGIGPKSVKALDQIEKMLESKRFNTVCIACRAIAVMGPAAKRTKVKLISIAKNGNASERGRAIQALAGIGAFADDAEVRQLIEDGFTAPIQSIRERTSLGLQQCGSDAKDFVPFVENAIKDPTFRSKPIAAMTLIAIGGSSETAVNALAKSLSNPVYEMESIESLGKLGPKAKAASPKLIKYLDSKDDHLRETAIHSLIRIELQAKPNKLDAIEKSLREIVENGSFRSVRAARVALKKIAEIKTKKE